MNNENNGYDYKPRSKKKKGRIGIKIAAGTAACLLFACAAFYAYGASLVKDDKVAKGVTVGNVDLSDLTVSEAAVALASFDEASPITLTFEDMEFMLDPNEIPYELNTEMTAEKAFLYGKTGNIFTKILTALQTKNNPIDILPVYIFDPDALADKMNDFGNRALGEASDDSAVISDNDEILLTSGSVGYDGDPTDAITSLEEAMENDIKTTISVNFNEKEPEELTLEKLKESISTQGSEASFTLENGNVIIKEGQSGYTFDEEEAEKAIKTLNETGETVQISGKPIKPKYTVSELKNKLFNAELASYSTRYNARQANRSKNVAVAAEKLNDVIILPGETFSFNQTVGKRTTSNGFMSAPEYLNGQTVTGIGGGTCQVSTTLYSAVLYANLEIVSRRNHSMSVSYVPLGQDATVTDGGTDFKFKNNTEFPVKIKTSASGGTLTVKIIGTAPEPPVTVKIVNTKTSELSAVTTRILYDANGNEISSQKVATSKYKPHGSENSAATNSAPASAPAPAPSSAPANTAAPEATQAPADTKAPAAEPVKTEAPSVTQIPKPETENNSQPAQEAPAEPAVPPVETKTE